MIPHVRLNRYQLHKAGHFRYFKRRDVNSAVPSDRGVPCRERTLLTWAHYTSAKVKAAGAPHSQTASLKRSELFPIIYNNYSLERRLTLFKGI